MTRAAAGHPLYVGDAARGEIQLATTAAEVARAADAHRRRARALGLPPEAEALGHVLGDEFIDVYRDPVLFPSGAAGAYLRVEQRGAGNGGAVVLPVAAGRLILRRMFRHPTRAWELEAPRGFGEPDEPPETTARREVGEELGVVVERLTPLGAVAANTGLLATVSSAFVADVRESGSPARPEATEALGAYRRLAPDEVVAALASGEVRDGFTLAALALAWARGVLR